MDKNVSLSKRTYALLENIRRMLEMRGNKLSHDEIIFEALSLYKKIGLTGVEEMLLAVWSRLDEIDKKIMELENELKSSISAITPQIPKVRGEAEAKIEERESESRFLEFMKDVVVYPLNRIRKKREAIEKIIYQGLLTIVEVGGQRYLIYKPKLDMLMARLPLSIDKVKELSDREKQLVNILKAAGILYEDAKTRSIRRV